MEPKNFFRGLPEIGWAAVLKQSMKGRHFFCLDVGDVSQTCMLGSISRWTEEGIYKEMRDCGWGGLPFVSSSFFANPWGGSVALQEEGKGK